MISPNFDRSEFACKCGCGYDTVDAELIRVLDEVRSVFGDRAVVITSGCRCRSHNETVGGWLASKHLVGKAADFYISQVDCGLVAEYLEQQYFDRYGIGRYDTWTHLDVRERPARWGDRKDPPPAPSPRLSGI